MCMIGSIYSEQISLVNPTILPLFSKRIGQLQRMLLHLEKKLNYLYPYLIQLLNKGI